jgi:hypothetical protein
VTVTVPGWLLLAILVLVVALAAWVLDRAWVRWVERPLSRWARDRWGKQ